MDISRFQIKSTASTRLGKCCQHINALPTYMENRVLQLVTYTFLLEILPFQLFFDFLKFAHFAYRNTVV